MPLGSRRNVTPSEVRRQPNAVEGPRVSLKPSAAPAGHLHHSGLSPQIKKPPRRCFSGEAFRKTPLGHCEVSSRRTVSVSFSSSQPFSWLPLKCFLRELFPLQGVFGSGVALADAAQLLVWAHLLIQDIAAVLQPCQHIFLLRGLVCLSRFSSPLRVH